MRKTFLVLAGALLAATVAAPARADDDRVQFGRSIHVGEGETVADVVCFGCSIRIAGTAAGDVVSFGGGIAIDGEVGGDVVAFGGSVRLGPNANVGGAAMAFGGGVQLGPESHVGGEVATFGGRVERDPTAHVSGTVSTNMPLPIASLSGLLFFLFVVTLICNLILVLLTYLIAGERRVETLAATIRQRAGMSFLTGLGVLFAAVFLFVLSAFLGPVTPFLAVLVAVVLFLTLLVGYAGLSLWAGRLLAQSSAPLAAVVLGAVLVTAANLVPPLCFVLPPILLLLGLGSAALSGFGASSDWLPQQFGSRPPG